jgi:hypothetical protein
LNHPSAGSSPLAHAIVMASRYAQVFADASVEVLNELLDVTRPDLHVAVHRVIPLPDGDDMDLIRYLDGRRPFREEQRRKRDPLFAITLLAHVFIILPVIAAPSKAQARSGDSDGRIAGISGV